MDYILFASDSDSRFQITARSACWDGIIEYSYDNQIWQEWHGETIINNKIYMRGINNTVVSGGSNWIINGKHITCQGNIENLLDYKSVINKVHPIMQDYCFAYMFWSCHSLIVAPSLDIIKLSKKCFYRMYENCRSLTISPIFPNLTIAKDAIINQHILEDCPIQFININNKLYDINVLKLL